MKLQMANVAESAPFSAQYEFSVTSDHNARSNVPLCWSVKLVGQWFSQSLSHLMRKIVARFLLFFALGFRFKDIVEHIKIFV